MPKLSILRPGTRNFQEVVTQSLNSGAYIVRDLTADPWRYYGSYLTFDYAAKTDKPYDRYPLIMLADYNEATNTLVGYNYHHLPIHRRLWLLESMSGNLAALVKGFRDEHASQEEENKERAKVVSNFLRKIVSWKQMGKYFSACTRQYKIRQIKSEIILIPGGAGDLLDEVMMVPYEKIYNGTRREILEKSKAVYMQEAKRE
jgi:hypothetical protein